MADEKIELTAEMEQFVKYIEGLTVLDLSKLVKALEERLGVSASVLWSAFTGFATVGAVAFFAEICHFWWHMHLFADSVTN